MKKYYLRILQVFILLTYVTGLSAQMNMPADTSYHSNEKIYIHYDKPYYAAGETIWFKCYLYDKGLPSVGSQNLYLQLIDPFGKITEIKKYPLSGATAKGNINLSSALTEGFYTIRAVTPATATNNDLIYSKNIYIYNPSVKIKDTIVPKKISIQFFPESGNLIDSIFTQVGFKATDEKGNPAEVNGVIKSSNDAVVATLEAFSMA